MLCLACFCRNVGVWLKNTPIPTDFVALLDEWAARFFEELDYVREGNNATKFAAQMKADLPQVMHWSCVIGREGRKETCSLSRA